MSEDMGRDFGIITMNQCSETENLTNFCTAPALPAASVTDQRYKRPQLQQKGFQKICILEISCKATHIRHRCMFLPAPICVSAV